MGIGSIHQNMMDTMSENEREKRERRAKDVRLLGVQQREQLPRNIKQNVSYVAPLHADSDDEFDSEDSEEFEDSGDSCRMSDLLRDQTYEFVDYDTEGISGLEKEEFREITNPRRDYVKRPREQPPPVLARFNSENRHSQKYVISAGPEGRGEEEGEDPC